MKKPLVWLTLLSMIIALLPVGLISTAEAASATYFIPDDPQLLKTANIELGKDSNTDRENIRNTVKVVNTPTLEFNGSYSKISDQKILAQIDMMTWKESKDSSGTGSWQVNPQYSTTESVQIDSANNNKFKAPGLTLFEGLNKITLKGRFGNVEVSDVFYVLYDKIPYFTKLTLNGDGISNGVNLNEDSRVISKNQMVYVSGDVFNANKVTTSVNGGTEMSTEIFNNLMMSSPVTLTPGLNELKLTFTNGSDSFTVTREIYYFTAEQPFVGMYAVHDMQSGLKEYNLLNSTPLVKQLPSEIVLQLMLPYNTTTDKFYPSNYEVWANGVDVTGQINALSSKLYETGSNGEKQFKTTPVSNTSEAAEEPISDATGPVYRMVTFSIPTAGLNLTPVAGTDRYEPKIEVKYNKSGTGWKTEISYTPNFVRSDSVAIQEINYLPDYGIDKNVLNKKSLNGAVIAKSEYYIEVVTDGATQGNLTANFLPQTSANGLTVEFVSGTKTTTTKGQEVGIYKVSGAAVGEKRISFKFDNSLSKEVSVSFSVAVGIIIDNLVDGQTYEIDTAGTTTLPTLTITGKYYGVSDINKWTTAEYFINGIRGDGDKESLINTSNKNFSIKANIDSANGPLTAGENTIEFRGEYLDSLNNRIPVSKKIRIYIVDKNVANVISFKPGVPLDEKNFQFPAYDLFANPNNETQNQLAAIMKLPKEFTLENEAYVTNEGQYNLTIRGGGAHKLNLSFGSENILSLSIPTDPPDPSNPTTPVWTDLNSKSDGTYTAIKGEYVITAVGSQKDFLIRISSNSNANSTQGVMRFDEGTAGTHVYNLELINKTGARASQRVEITRKLGGYVLKAPKATVGDQIVVNKNFVHFDIEAAGATKVLIGKDEATRISEAGKVDRFVYDYIGLKPDKLNKINIQIVRPNASMKDTINVYYTSSLGIDSQFMAEKVTNKYTVFNKALTLSFPKGTIMQSFNAIDGRQKERKFYPDNRILFGIADPKNGIVERVDDYNNYYIDYLQKPIPEFYLANFTTVAQTFNFSRISDIYWISGGLGESATEPSTNGVAPYSVHGFFTSPELENRKIVPSERGTLTLAYDKNVVSDAGTQITVFKYTRVGTTGMWERVPGIVNTGQNTVQIPFDEFGYYAVYKLNRSFNDVTNHPWARNILNSLYSKGIMEYSRADTFGADDQTTRGEFATLLVKGLSLPINADDSQKAFFDVQNNVNATTWDYKHIETAARAGIITGKKEGFFAPTLPITRQEAAVMIARAVKLKLDTNDDKLAGKLAKTYLDSGKIEYYARPAVQAVTGAKIMSGNPITLQGQKKASFNFNPTGNMTRAEAGKIAVELFKVNKSTKAMFPKNFN